LATWRSWYNIILDSQQWRGKPPGGSGVVKTASTRRRREENAATGGDMTRLLWAAALLAAHSAAMPPAQAQDDATKNYPQKTIRMIVPYAPGGGTDVLGRVAGKEISEALGQPVVIENKPGASAIIGTDMVARSNPDGYTLLVAPSGPLVMNPVL